MPLNSRLLGDVVKYVERQFGDESGVQITEDDIIRWTNQGLMEITSKNKVLRASASTVSVGGTSTYSKPDDCLQMTAVSYDGRLLKGIGFDEFQNIYTVDVQDEVCHWSMYGDSIILGATPSDSDKTILIYYIPEPQHVADLSTVLPIPDRYFNVLCEFVMSKAYELDEDWTAHNTQRQLFEDNLSVAGHAETVMTGPYPVVIDYDY